VGDIVGETVAVLANMVLSDALDGDGTAVERHAGW